MQKENQPIDREHNRPTSTRGCNDSMHSVQLHDGCTDRGFKCQSMSLNARCAKSVLKWISQSMRNDRHNAAGRQ